MPHQLTVPSQRIHQESQCLGLDLDRWSFYRYISRDDRTYLVWYTYSWWRMEPSLAISPLWWMWRVWLCQTTLLISWWSRRVCSNVSSALQNYVFGMTLRLNHFPLDERYDTFLHPWEDTHLSLGLSEAREGFEIHHSLEITIWFERSTKGLFLIILLRLYLPLSQ